MRLDCCSGCLSLTVYCTAFTEMICHFSTFIVSLIGISFNSGIDSEIVR